MLRMQRVLLLSFALASLGCGAKKPVQGPSLAGYTLGARWSDVGRSLVCEPVRTEAPILPTALPYDLRVCHASDSTTLAFARDTLFLIRLYSYAKDTVFFPNIGLASRWQATASSPAVLALGPADSVSLVHMPPNTDCMGERTDLYGCERAVARWSQNSSRQWSAVVDLEIERSHRVALWSSVHIDYVLYSPLVSGLPRDYAQYSAPPLPRPEGSGRGDSIRR
jgi:hypothetical protein